LHAIGKLGFAVSGYGTVNVILLSGALFWSVAAFLIAAKTYEVDLTISRALRFVLSSLLVVAATSLIGIVFDNWFSTHFLAGLALELLELFVAGCVSWIIFFRPLLRNRSSNILGGGLFGILGLIGTTSVGLLFFPRVTFRL